MMIQYSDNNIQYPVWDPTNITTDLDHLRQKFFLIGLF